jgi:hypothetical protein
MVFVGLGLCAIALGAIVLGRGPGGIPIGAMVLMVLGAALTYASVRRSPPIRIEDGRVWRGSLPVELGRSPRLVLTGRLGNVERLRPAYGVLLRVPEGDIKLLEHSNPAVVLMDLRRILASWDIAVESGWGLPDDAIRPDSPRMLAGPSLLELSFQGRPGRSYREAGLTVLATGILIFLVLGRMVADRVSAGTPASTVSLAVPALLLVTVLFAGALVLTLRTTLTVGRAVVYRQQVLGLTLRELELPVAMVWGLYAVAPVSGEVLHVLVDLGDRVLAVPCPETDASERIQALRSAINGRENHR